MPRSRVNVSLPDGQSAAMTGFLNRVSVLQVMGLLTTSGFVVAYLFAAIELVDGLGQKRLTAQTRAYSDLLTAQTRAYSDLSVGIGDLVHELQKEQGITSGFLAGGDTAFASRLIDRRSLSDKAVPAFDEAAARAGIEGSPLAASHARAAQHLSALSEPRRRRKVRGAARGRRGHHRAQQGPHRHGARGRIADPERAHRARRDPPRATPFRKGSRGPRTRHRLRWLRDGGNQWRDIPRADPPEVQCARPVPGSALRRIRDRRHPAPGGCARRDARERRRKDRGFDARSGQFRRSPAHPRCFRHGLVRRDHREDRRREGCGDGKRRGGRRARRRCLPERGLDDPPAPGAASRPYASARPPARRATRRLTGKHSGTRKSRPRSGLRPRTSWPISWMPAPAAISPAASRRTTRRACSRSFRSASTASRRRPNRA
jgi:Nitrate and nitrite sensing